MDKKKRVHLIINGMVQGVCFRMETQRTAKSEGVFGWVRNLSNGDVEALLEGDEDAVNAVIQWCHQGPSFSRVDEVIIEDQEYQGEFQDFKITY
ncbi:Acylphosphatase [Desulfamplus magnetovallimortis]|uniref:Acylphosphatase n=1 Tax=Desulfamplus magnetovallimortis TaxID=1246637 RepID=A0A1W1HDV6_9BACT|nr:acylphosphatase [Desulfamplus magnetovallimortis]SLM30555.1 Acylphosphatase [Desulfamplus magnetovallimortis]